mmetsp:Transcript_1972/g.4328  ORF Transcript_1972/g.4328 Transcript_1972/m.4328 type:complete len:204 (-) Transcript_1972:310-921(-)
MACWCRRDVPLTTSLRSMAASEPFGAAIRPAIGPHETLSSIPSTGRAPIVAQRPCCPWCCCSTSHWGSIKKTSVIKPSRRTKHKSGCVGLTCSCWWVRHAAHRPQTERSSWLQSAMCPSGSSTRRPYSRSSTTRTAPLAAGRPQRRWTGGACGTSESVWRTSPCGCCQTMTSGHTSTQEWLHDAGQKQQQGAQGSDRGSGCLE